MNQLKIKKKAAANKAYNGHAQQKLVTPCMRDVGRNPAGAKVETQMQIRPTTPIRLWQSFAMPQRIGKTLAETLRVLKTIQTDTKKIHTVNNSI